MSFKKIFIPKKKAEIPGDYIYFTDDNKKKFNSWCTFHIMYYVYFQFNIVLYIFSLILLIGCIVLPFAIIYSPLGIFLGISAFILHLGFFSLSVIMFNRRHLNNTYRVFGVTSFDDFLKKIGVK
jgi:uncharacterized membrane protein